MPWALAKISMLMCWVAPGPGVAYLTPLGLALAAATMSFTDLNGLSALTARPIGTSTSWASGTKSLVT